MEIKTPTGVGGKVGGASDTIIIIALLAGVGVLLWKSGIFKLASTVTGAAGTVVKDVVNLPANIVQGVEDLGQLPLAIAQNAAPVQTVDTIFATASKGTVQKKSGYISAVVGTIPKAFPGVATITQRTANMIASCVAAYPGCTATNWSAISVAHHAVYDANGFIISDDSTNPPVVANEPTSTTTPVTAAQLRALNVQFGD